VCWSSPHLLNQLQDGHYKLQAATDKSREKVMMRLEWQSVQKQLCQSVRAPKPWAHCDMKMPGLVTEVIKPPLELLKLFPNPRMV
jgi:hypothetical protein